MQLEFQSRHEFHAFTFAVGIVGLSVIAIISFAFFGGGVLFYIFAVLAIALGFYMAYHLSKGPSASQAVVKTARRKPRRR